MLQGRVGQYRMSHLRPMDAGLPALYPTTPKKLTEKRQSYNGMKDLEELTVVREMRARCQVRDCVKTNTQLRRGCTTNLPKPDPPGTYTKRYQAEYDRWGKYCKGFFLHTPDNLVTVTQRVGLGIQYVSEELETLWRAYSEAQ
jgi:hypothetical protein